MERPVLIGTFFVSALSLFVARKLWPEAPLSDEETFVVVVCITLTVLAARRLHLRLTQKTRRKA